MKILLTIILTLIFVNVKADTVPVSNSLGLNNTIPRYVVSWMYEMKIRYWEDGTRVTVFNMDLDSPIHKAFVRNVLQKSPVSYQQSIERLTNSGNAGRYKTVDTENEMIKQVSGTTGAIGYINKDTLLISRNGGIHEIKIVD